MVRAKKKKKTFSEQLDDNPNVSSIDLNQKDYDDILESEFSQIKNHSITTENIKEIQSEIIKQEIEKGIKTTNIQIQSIEIDNFPQEQWNKAKELLEQNIKTKAVVLYVWNKDYMSAKLLGITEVNPVLHIRTTKELYLMENPIFIIDGKPIFMIIRGIPYSLEIILNVNRSQHFFFKLKGYTPTEIHAKIRSIYTNVLYRQNPSMKFYFYMICLMTIEALSCHIIYSNYYEARIKEAKKGFLVMNFLKFLI